MNIAVPKYGKKLGQGFPKTEQLAALEFKRQTNPQRGYQTSASWLSDLINLRKAIILCSFCRNKFNPRRFGYRRIFTPDITGKTDGYIVNGRCDWCNQMTPLCGGGTGYLSEEEYLKTHIDPSEARRQARAAAGAMTSWQYLQSQRQKGVQRRISP